jgi:plastocyanin
MNKTVVFLTVTGIAAGLQMAAAGDISGTITLKGTPAPEKEITQVKEDPNCGKLHTEVVKTRFYVVGSKGELGDVFVTLKGISGKSKGAEAPPLVLDQKGCEYLPYIFTVQTGQKITVKNSDPVLHNIHPTPAASGNKEENKAQMPGGADLAFTFPTAETFLRFKCDVHPWMFAYACVTDHPYAAVTDKDGKYTLKGVPDGKYTIEVYHRKAAPATAPMTRDVEVKGGNLTEDFTLEAK